jgi:transposase
LKAFGRELLVSLYEELSAVDQRIGAMEERIQRVFHNNAQCRKIAAVEGIGPLTATAVVAAVADGKTFRNGGR